MDWLQRLLKIVRDDYLKDSYNYQMVDGGLNLSYEVAQLENIVDVIKSDYLILSQKKSKMLITLKTKSNLRNRTLR